MLSFLDKIFGSKPKDYQGQTRDLQSADVSKRLSLAKNRHTNKEVLYYLAEKDPEAMVRQAVVGNRAMPLQAATVLAYDRDIDVRLMLAARLVELLPDLSDDKHSQLYAFAVQALGTLALDEVLKIRTALSSTLKDHAHTPPKIAGQLARDVEREVSEPILRFCAALSDEDLLDILRAHPASWVVRAIAGRGRVSEPVSEAVIDVEDVPGGAVLIENQGALITENLLQHIVEKAKSFPEWQKPMALRKSLPVSIAKQMAEFVDGSVRKLLLSRNDFDEQDTAEISAIFRRRMDFAADDVLATESIEMRLKKRIAEGMLGEDMVSDALAMRDQDFLYGAVAYLAKSDMLTVRKIFEMKAPKPIVALCWRAGLSMRLALQLQMEIGQIPPKELIYPKDGTDYPLSESDLKWQLEFLGLKVA
jgi:uncharacterized protein (DUF2336 family)